MLFNFFIPRYSLRRVIVGKIYHTLLGHSKGNTFYKLANFFNRENLAVFKKYNKTKIVCNICNSSTGILFDFPDVDNRIEHKVGLLRETLQCRTCGATMRDRTLAYGLLRCISKTEAGSKLIGSIDELSKKDKININVLDTDSFSKMSRLMKGHEIYIRSSYCEDIPFGVEIEDNRFNINLQKIDFADEKFDIVLTSDVVEHIRDVDRAHNEIYRVLKKGGTYIFTVPYDKSCLAHHELVDTRTDEDIYLVPPQLHGDPLTGGILAYRVFGQKIFKDLEDIGFSVEFLEVDQVDSGIYKGDLFFAVKK